MRLKLLLVIAFNLFLVQEVAAQANIDVNAKIDETLTKYLDVTGDGQDDRIILRIRGRDFTHPFTWSLEIESNGKCVFRHESDDAWLDRFFHDVGYVDDCNGYVGCKRKYYFHDLLEFMFIRTDLSGNPHAFDEANSGSIHTIGRKHLTDVCRVSDKTASDIVRRMMDQIQSGKAVLLYVPISPVHSEIPRMYVSEVERFVPIYQW